MVVSSTIDFGHQIKKNILELNDDKFKLIASTSVDMPAILCFYAASLFVGDDILEYENETIELVLLRSNISPKIIEKSVYVKNIIANIDGTLTVPQYFKVASDVLNDHELHTDTIGVASTEEILWSTTCLIAITNADNIPLDGDALRYAVACMKSEGWTMPPFFFNVEKVNSFFEYYDKSIYESVKCDTNTLFKVCSVDAPRDADTNWRNFSEMHKPLIQYFVAKMKELEMYFKKIG